MFGKRKTDTLIENIDSYFDAIDRSLLVYKEGVRNYLYDSERTQFEDNLKRLSELEAQASELRRGIEEATRCAQEIKRTVFHKMDKLKLSEKFHLRYFALHIENLSKAADGLADQLAVMSIRRTM